MTILVTWTLADGTTGKAEFTDDRLDEVLERTWRKFGNGEQQGIHERIHAESAQKQAGRDDRKGMAKGRVPYKWK